MVLCAGLIRGERGGGMSVDGVGEVDVVDLRYPFR